MRTFFAIFLLPNTRPFCTQTYIPTRCISTFTFSSYDIKQYLLATQEYKFVIYIVLQFMKNVCMVVYLYLYQNVQVNEILRCFDACYKRIEHDYTVTYAKIITFVKIIQNLCSSAQSNLFLYQNSTKLIKVKRGRVDNDNNVAFSFKILFMIYAQE